MGFVDSEGGIYVSDIYRCQWGVTFSASHARGTPGSFRFREARFSFLLYDSLVLLPAPFYA